MAYTAMTTGGGAFVLDGPLAADAGAGTAPRPRRVLVTGAAGRIGSYFAEHHDRDRFALRLMVRAGDDPAAVERIRPAGEVVVGDLADMEALKGFCAGTDAVLHLAGDPSPSATWASLHAANVVGTYHVFAAAKEAGCRRVVYASSIHAVSGYAADVQVKASEPVNPGDLYGVSKCFGEALARYMAEQEGVGAICVRIGAFQPLEAARDAKGLKMADAFVSHRDLHQLLERCLDAPDGLRFAILHGLSNNRFKRLDISDARTLVGYEPQDDFTEESPALKDLHLSETVAAHDMGDGEQSGLREDVSRA